MYCWLVAMSLWTIPLDMSPAVTSETTRGLQLAPATGALVSVLQPVPLLVLLVLLLASLAALLHNVLKLTHLVRFMQHFSVYSC